MAQYVYVLDHLHVLPDGEEDWKKLGIYATREEAEAAIEYYLQQPGFKDQPEGFNIDRWELGEKEWMEGFITYVPSEAYKEDLRKEGKDLMSEALELAEKANTLINDINDKVDKEFLENQEKHLEISLVNYPKSSGSEYDTLRQWGDKYQEIRNDIYSLIRLMLDDKEDYNLSYEVKNELVEGNQKTKKEALTLILKIRKK